MHRADTTSTDRLTTPTAACRSGIVQRMPSSDHRLLQLPATFALPEARAAGITPKQRQGRQLLSVSRGLYEQRFRPAPDLVGRCQALARLLPTGAAYSHDTAGALLGLPSVGVGVGVGFVGIGLHVTVPAGRPAPRRRGVTTHRSDLEPADVASAHGLALTAPGRIFTDLAPRLWLEDLVALGDHLVRSGSASLGELAGRTAARHPPSRRTPVAHRPDPHRSAGRIGARVGVESADDLGRAAASDTATGGVRRRRKVRRQARLRLRTMAAGCRVRRPPARGARAVRSRSAAPFPVGGGVMAGSAGRPGGPGSWQRPAPGTAHRVAALSPLTVQISSLSERRIHTVMTTPRVGGCCALWFCVRVVGASGVV